MSTKRNSKKDLPDDEALDEVNKHIKDAFDILKRETNKLRKERNAFDALNMFISRPCWNLMSVAIFSPQVWRLWLKIQVLYWSKFWFWIKESDLAVWYTVQSSLSFNCLSINSNPICIRSCLSSRENSILKSIVQNDTNVLQADFWNSTCASMLV